LRSGHRPADHEHSAAEIAQAADPPMLRHGVHEYRGAASVFARSIVALQSSTAKIEFHVGDTPQSRPIGRMPPSWKSPRFITV
jgi:hypothetical protein